MGEGKEKVRQLILAAHRWSSHQSSSTKRSAGAVDVFSSHSRRHRCRRAEGPISWSPSDRRRTSSAMGYVMLLQEGMSEGRTDMLRREARSKQDSTRLCIVLRLHRPQVIATEARLFVLCKSGERAFQWRKVHERQLCWHALICSRYARQRRIELSRDLAPAMGRTAERVGLARRSQESTSQ